MTVTASPVVPALVRPLPGGAGWAYTEHVLAGPTSLASVPTLGVVYSVVTEAARFEAIPPAIVELLLDGGDLPGLLGLFDLLIQDGRGTATWPADVIVEVRDRIAGNTAA